jgi:hypothetical protein
VHALGTLLGPPSMLDFLKDYWLWILVPFVLVLGGLGLLVVLGGEGLGQFSYNIF